MATDWEPPGRSFHFRVFIGCLVVIALGLAGLLFGVPMETVVPADGIITSTEIEPLRAQDAGLVKPGYYEATAQIDGETVAVRMDANGFGRTAVFGSGRILPVARYQVMNGSRQLPVQGKQFHRLQPGDVVWPGQPVGNVDDHSILIPDKDQAWQVLQVNVEPAQAVKPGDVLVRVVPVDTVTLAPSGLMARLDVEERYWGEVRVGQEVRLFSMVHNHRLYGSARGRIERLEPMGVSGDNGRRYFRAIAAIEDSPFPLPLHSSCRGEIMIGDKLVYRIILER